MSQCAVNVAGLGQATVKRDRHPVWYPPAGSAAPGLNVLNSLTETLEPFVPLNGRNIKWYTCGPTVYDSAHMGHARAYLTFDILRRIMEDYFRYNIVYQMNITDIDDKIIKRARINKLFSDYRGATKEVAALKKDVDKAVSLVEQNLDKKAQALKDPLPATASTRQKEEREEKEKELSFKRELLEGTKKLIAKSESEGLDALLAAGKPVLEDWLDANLGSTVNDTQIFDAHSRRYEKEFMEDMKALGVREPDIITRVTEFVPSIISYIERIMANGFGYVGKSSVFFDLNSYNTAGHNYPKLKPVACAHDNTTSAEELAESEGALAQAQDGEKRNPNDFALWKFSKPGEPSWPSPWGPGRPGWHIECSVMASDILGENFDVHGGGVDLKFPHHDNEIAQAEAYWNNGQWVNYFLHAGHLHIKGLKMAKSLKNFITIRQALQEHSAAELRMMFLLQQWHKPMNFSDQTVGDAREKLRVLRAFFGNVQVIRRGDFLSQIQTWVDEEAALHRKIVALNDSTHKALCDNFNTPDVITAILDVVSDANKYMESNPKPNAFLLTKASREIAAILKIFGLNEGDEGQAGNSSAAASTEIVDALVKFRDDVRSGARGIAGTGPVFGACDRLRDEVLPPLGIRLEDAPDGPTKWKAQNPEELMREIELRKREAKEAESKKIINKLDQKRDELAKWTKAKEDPSAIYKNAKFSAWDAEGVPTKMADGSAISNSLQKQVKKDYSKAVDMRADLEKKGGDKYLASIQEEIAVLEAKLKA